MRFAVACPSNPTGISCLRTGAGFAWIRTRSGSTTGGSTVRLAIPTFAGLLRRFEGVPGPLFLGVDRLDYTKGIAERLRAFERLLRFEPGLHERAKFIQVAIPSREDVAGYAPARKAVESLVASINARYETPTWRPVEYLYESPDCDTLIALYCAADVMVVTPRRDGMNLVAKEFVACRCDEGGALVLSSTAGAATELGAAVLVDPTDVSSIMEGYRRALALSAADRRARMRRLRAAVRLNNVRAWASCCLDGAFEAVAGSIGTEDSDHGSARMERLERHPDFCEASGGSSPPTV